MLFEKIELEPGEEILKTVRKHWFIFAAELVGTFIALMVPFIFLSLATSFPKAFELIKVNPFDHIKILTFVLCGWFILVIMSAFTIWTHYFLDLWIITDRRIIRIDQIHFFNRTVSIFRLERLQDIEFSIKGLIPTFLNFGTLTAQNAGHFENNFRSTGLPDPRGLQATIQRAMDDRLRVLHIDPDI